MERVHDAIGKMVVPGSDMRNIEINECSDMGEVFEAILELDRAMRGRFALNMLSHEFRLILQLFTKKHLIVKDAALSSQLSSRAFYELLKRLEQERVLASGRHPDDGRAKSIQLEDAFALQMLDQFIGNAFLGCLASRHADRPARHAMGG